MDLVTVWVSVSRSCGEYAMNLSPARVPLIARTDASCSTVLSGFLSVPAGRYSRRTSPGLRFRFVSSVQPYIDMSVSIPSPEPSSFSKVTGISTATRGD